MPSPFPGMDPFIEGHEWSNFHTLLIVEIHHALLRALRPRYVVAVEKHVFLATEFGERQGRIVPDVSIGDRETTSKTAFTESAHTNEPLIVTLPQLERIEQPYVYIRDSDSTEIVTIIELLSPSNKAIGSGRDSYITKREQLLNSGTHLVEFDLLRGGERLPIVEQLPEADYFACVSRTEERPRAQLFHWTLRDQLPIVPIPLINRDESTPLDLQSVFNATYDNAGYDYILNYQQPVHPQLSPNAQQWIGQILNSQAPSEPD